ncbi:hypothetical protein K2Y00_00230 [Patescibacteria group bacterium]|nr:hypothetical protein [Patescibacteria group bacterium]
MAQPGLEGLRGRDNVSEIVTFELGPDHAPLTLLPEETERGKEVHANVLGALRPTAYCVPGMDSGQLTRAVDDNPEEHFTYSNSLVRVAYQEGRPVYLIGGHMPDILRDVGPDTLRKVNHWPRIIAAGTLVTMAAHMATPPKPETQTRRAFLKGSIVLGAAATLYASFFPNGVGDDDIEERLARYSEEDLETMVQWYKTLRGFSNLVLATKLTEVARLHGQVEGEHVLALAPPHNDGLRRALQISPGERDALILDFLKNVVEPIAQAGSISEEEYSYLLGVIGTFIEARPVQDSPTPQWEETEHPAFALY